MDVVPELALLLERRERRRAHVLQVIHPDQLARQRVARRKLRDVGLHPCALAVQLQIMLTTEHAGFCAVSHCASCPTPRAPFLLPGNRHQGRARRARERHLARLSTCHLAETLGVSFATVNRIATNDGDDDGAPALRSPEGLIRIDSNPNGGVLPEWLRPKCWQLTSPTPRRTNERVHPPKLCIGHSPQRLDPAPVRRLCAWGVSKCCGPQDCAQNPIRLRQFLLPSNLPRIAPEVRAGV